MYLSKGKIAVARNPLTLSLFLVLIISLSNCKNKVEEPQMDMRGFPQEIGDIMLNQCATAGCHTDQSKIAAGGLSLSSWDKLFEGSKGGAPVIPYRADQSYLMYAINPGYGDDVVLSPTMPFNASPLSVDQYNLVKDWINNGAMNDLGQVKFADNPERRKFYVTNQGCDMISVFDAHTQILMRYVDVGSSSEVESPHQIKVAPDGEYWYTIFFVGSTIEKYNAENDQHVGSVTIGEGSWNTFRISEDGKIAVIVDWNANGSIAIVDLDNMKLIERYQGSSRFVWPHGSYLNKKSTQIYVTAQHGNFIYKIDITDVSNPITTKVSLNKFAPTTVPFLDPHEIEMTPDESMYFLTCQKTNEIRVMKTSNDSLLAVWPSGEFPQEMALSEKDNLLFVTCTEDAITYPGKTGSVYIYDYQKMEFVKSMYTGIQPHGITVDEKENKVYIAHRNVSESGPTPHHSSSCEGRNGFVVAIDLESLELQSDYKVEVGVDPYGMGIRN